MVMNKLFAVIAVAVIGSALGIGQADNIIQAFVQQFGATPHEVLTAPNDVKAVQIDWSFNKDFNLVTDCDLVFDKIVPAGSTLICKVSGHGSELDPAKAGKDQTCTNKIDDDGDGLIDGADPKCHPLIGGGKVLLPSPGPGAQTIRVDIDCEPLANDPGFDRINTKELCDVQDIEDVKVIVVGKETTDVRAPTGAPTFPSQD